jgi:spoIIIJ-associated protein
MPVKKQEIEARGPDVEEAIASGLNKLGVTRDKVEIDVVDEGRRGLLGIGGREAVVRLRVLSDPEPIIEPAARPIAPQAVKKVELVQPPQETAVVTPPPPAAKPAAEKVDIPSVPASSSDETDAAVALVGELLDMMRVKAAIDFHYTEADDLTGRQLTVVDIHGDDLSALIGPRGETLDALQYISRLMVGHRIQQRAHFVIDVEGYRERREQALTRLAERMADKAVKRGSPVTLEAMPAHERRIIHVALRNSPEVKTESTGEGNRRRVRIFPK